MRDRSTVRRMSELWAIVSRWTILFLLGSVAAAALWDLDGVDGYGSRGRRKKAKEKKHIKISMRFRDLGLKILCEEEEWKEQFRPVKYKLAKCLGLEKLYLDWTEEPTNKEERDPIENMLSPFKAVDENPYCRIHPAWTGCTYHFEGMHCLEPDPTAFGGSVSSYSAMVDHLYKDRDNYSEESMNYMVRLYRNQCESARFAAQSMQSSFSGGMGGMGGGDYGSDYGGDDGEEAAQADAQYHSPVETPDDL